MAGVHIKFVISVSLSAPYEMQRVQPILNKEAQSMTRFAGVERRQRIRADRKSMEIERLIEKTFEAAVLTHLFPTSQIDIYCQIIQSDGSHLAACVNAASLAMSDAGIPMKGIVAAATCSIVDGQPVVDVNQREETDLLPRLTSDGSHLAACVNAASLAMSDAGIPMKGIVAAATCSIVDGQPVVDVNQREETDLLPRLTLATLRGEDEVVLVELQNRVHIDHLPALMAAAKDTCKGVHECICAAVVDQLENGAFLLR
ncbi:3' exoribonuclease family, domain 1 [Teladorsagia circumcincta]|uniref:3' exoribonuclease family, domain 1 n=1 Tax=Teladorsagia circumcincta TaxID=45464 RepID=A0A2G9UFX2_TELCI|nr:3' exoribonuclease family, domain 1 [Teladorsagia circumcincta]